MAKGSLLREMEGKAPDDIISLTDVSRALLISAAVFLPFEGSRTVKVRVSWFVSKSASALPLLPLRSVPGILATMCDGIYPCG